MKSCIYQGRLRHRRFASAKHEFSYKLFMLYLDLAELPELFDPYWLWSARGFAPAWFNRKDYLFNPDMDLLSEVRALIRQTTGQQAQGPVRLLTQLRYWGYGFNPLSLYYCFDAADTQVEYVVAETHNTPWNERHCYVLYDANRTSSTYRKQRFQHPKAFHVSPFMPMNLDYDWRLLMPDEQLLVHIENQQAGKRIFDATLTMQRRAINSHSLAAMLLQHPLLSWKVIFAIYYQAARLWLKRVPYIPHPT